MPWIVHVLSARAELLVGYSPRAEAHARPELCLTPHRSDENPARLKCRVALLYLACLTYELGE